VRVLYYLTMSETAARVAVTCPSCSPAVEIVHEVIKPGGQATVRCTDCDHVHKTQVPKTETRDTKVIVSQDGDSTTATAEVPTDEEIAVGEEFIVDTDEAILTVRITSLEVGTEQRADSALADEVETIWTRVVDNVKTAVTMHPHDGRHDATRSIEMFVPGDYEFTVGEEEKAGEHRFTVTGIQVREDARGYGFSKLDHEGDMAFAKDIKRVYAREESSRSTAWSGW
jgi:predicted Zn finger-like uncharacterized protein